MPCVRLNREQPALGIFTVSTPSRSGVFGSPADDRTVQFTESISYDHRLYLHDINGSIAHAQMLTKVGLINEAECQQIEQELHVIRQEIEQGKFEFSAANEDIHMAIEQRLTERLGDVGRKLHTARSRNDQVSTDLRMWVREAVGQLDEKLQLLQAAFLSQAVQADDLILPGYTHLQRAQPVLAAHYMLAYCEKFERDRQRLAEVQSRANVLPLGTGAVAGTSLPIDREMVCRQLGFQRVASNSLDASSDRDFVLDFCYAISMIGTHLSGWAEEWILWSTSEFNFIQLPDAFCTCSSMMPQKKNPDVLELIRGRASRIVGHLTGLLTLIKGLPLAYNRDLQEDKIPLFNSFDTVFSCVEIAIPLIEETHWNRGDIGAKLEEGYLDATTLMEYLILEGIPQRTAHHAVGTLVRQAIEMKIPLRELPLDAIRSVCESVDNRVYQVLGAKNALQTFRSSGSTNPDEVKQHIARWQKRLQRN